MTNPMKRYVFFTSVRFDHCYETAGKDYEDAKQKAIQMASEAYDELPDAVEVTDTLEVTEDPRNRIMTEAMENALKDELNFLYDIMVNADDDEIAPLKNLDQAESQIDSFIGDYGDEFPENLKSPEVFLMCWNNASAFELNWRRENRA